MIIRSAPALLIESNASKIALSVKNPFSMAAMSIGELLSLSLETMIVSLGMKIISVLVTVVLYGRMIAIYLYTSVAPIPFATFTNREWGQIGNNYARGLLALGFQGFFIMVLVGIY
mgnify:CR=1 FL=1